MKLYKLVKHTQEKKKNSSTINLNFQAPQK